jgi:hypothetical protein
MKSQFGGFYQYFVHLAGLLIRTIAGTFSAQVDQSAVSGVVTDQTGRGIVQAQFTPNSAQTGHVLTRATNASGLYNSAPIEVSSYTLAVSAPSQDAAHQVFSNYTVAQPPTTQHIVTRT